MPPQPGQSVVRFGSFRVDMAGQRLWNGSDPVTLRPKTWQVLRHLVEHADRLVSKHELLDAVWADVAVEEKAVNTCIGEIRTALGDSSRRPRFIETVQRRGFRFLASPSVDAADAVETGQYVRPAFIGRSHELASLQDRLHAAAGNATLTVICGAAGIGKSRLVREATERAGMRTLVGQCIEGGGIPYLPWVEMIHQHLRTRSSADTAATPAAAELRRLIPGLQPDSGDPIPPSTDPELARLRLFEALAEFFGSTSQDGPVVLVLEDIHWIDAASLRALQALAPQLGASSVQLVATLREEDAEPGSAVRNALEALRRRGIVVEVPLRGLAANETREMVADLAGPSVPSAVVARIADSSEGSPFFVEEILRHYGQDATREAAGSDAASAELHLPDNVIEIFERRIRHLSPAARRLVDAIAVCGRDCEEPLLELALDMQDAQLAAAASEAIDFKILRENPGSPGRYGFVHALMSVALRQRLAPPRLRELHASIADAVIATKADAGERAAEVARHLERAVPRVPAIRAIGALVEASEHAAHGLAYEDAIEHCERALSLARAAATGSSEHRCLPELSVRYAEALQKIGQAETVAAAFRAAAAAARQAGEPQWLARAALGMATIWDFEAPDVRGHLEGALECLGSEAGPLRARLLARLSVVLYPHAGTRSRCEALSTEAVELARGEGDATLLAQTLVDWLAGQWYLDNLAAQDAVSEELIDVARRSGDGALLATAHGWRVVIALCSGEIDRAEEHCEALCELAQRLGQPTYRWCGLYLSATLALLHGRLDVAERFASDAFEIGRTASPQSATIVYFTQMVSIRREQNRIGELLPMLEQNPASMSSDALTWNLPHFYMEADRVEDAASAFARACALGFDAMPGENSRNRRLLTLGAMSLACAALGDKAAAAPLYEIVRLESHRWAVAGFGAVNYGMVENGAGALAACLGNYAAACEHFERAIAEYERKNVPIALARACCLYADALLRRGSASDPQHAAALLQRADLLADELGLVRVREMARRVRESALRQ